MFFPFGGVPAFCMIADMGSETQTGGKKSRPTAAILRSLAPGPVRRLPVSGGTG